MRHTPSRRFALALIALAVTGATFAEEPKGAFGFVVKVAGAKASAMADRMRKKPGESVLLKLLRANGETYVVTLVAATPKH